MRQAQPSGGAIAYFNTLEKRSGNGANWAASAAAQIEKGLGAICGQAYSVVRMLLTIAFELKRGHQSVNMPYFWLNQEAINTPADITKVGAAIRKKIIWCMCAAVMACSYVGG